MTQQEAIQAAIDLNNSGHHSLIGRAKIIYVAQNADGSWNGYYDLPEHSEHCDEWDATESICLDRKWNDDWESSLAEVPL